MSEPTAAPAPARAWHQPCLADLVFLVVALVVLRSPSQSLLDDPGIGWHIRNLDAMLAQGGWLTEDPFSDSRGAPPARWLTNQWVGELPAWLGWKWAGLEGLCVAHALIIALLGRWLYLALVRDGLPWPTAVFWTAVALLGTSCSWIARPNLLTVLFVFLTARALVGLHEGTVSRAASFWLLPMFVLWANAHGGFVAGLMMIAVAFGVEVAIAVATGDRDAWGRAGFLVLLGAGSGLATLVNPYGFGLYHWVLGLLGDPFFMKLHTEWLSPDFHKAGSMRYELPLLLFPAVLAISARRPNLVDLALSILWLHFAFKGFRYVALWVVVAVPLMARASMHITWLNETAAKWGLNAESPDSLFHTRHAPSPWLWSAVIAVALLGGAKLVEGKLVKHDQGKQPTEMLDRLLDHLREWKEKKGRRPVLFHDYDWGGHIVWHGWPEFLNWIDDRNEVQGKEHIQEHIEITEAAPGWREKLKKVDWLCIRPDVPLARALADDKEWKKVDANEHAVIFVRRAAPPR